MREDMASRLRNWEPGTLWPPSGWKVFDTLPPGSGPLRAGFGVGTHRVAPQFDMHCQLEFGLLMAGRTRRHYRSYVTELKPGQVWFCSPCELHGSAVLTATCAYLGMTVEPQALLEAYFPEAPDMDWMAPFSAPPPRRPQAQGRRRSRLLAMARRAGMSVRPEAELAPAGASILLLELLLELTADWQGPRQKPAAREFYYPIVSKALGLISANPSGTSAAEAARACAVSAIVLDRAFRAVIGSTFRRFESRSRIAEAAMYLRETGEAVGDVARRFGFADSSSFSRAFRNHYQRAPTAFRRSV